LTHDLHFEPAEARVLGVLIEKSLTTPDQYPLSLNGLQLGCNQKSNRDPKVEMMEGEVFSAVERLRMMRLAGRVQAAGSRVEKFAHSAGQVLSADDRELAVLAELLMRGAQTKGELRTRANRMQAFASQDELAATLEALRNKGMVADLPPLAGSRAARVTETLSKLGQASAGGVAQPVATPAAAAPVRGAPPATASSSPTEASELEALTHRVTKLETDLARLAAALGESLEG